MPKIPFRFGEFAPDSEEYNDPSLEKLENGLPMYTGYRAIRKSEVKASTADDTEVITGAYTHLLSSDFDVQHGKTESTTGTPVGWFDQDGDNDTLHDAIGETSPNDSTYISWRRETNDPTFDELRLELSDLNDPGAGTGHIVGIRYRGWIDEGTGTLNVHLYEGSTKIDDQGGTGNVFWSNDVSTATGEWQYAEQVLATADCAAISDYTDLNLRIGGAISGMTGINTLLHIKPDADEDNGDNWTNESDESDNLYASINDVAVPADDPTTKTATYVKTPIISDGETSVYKAGFDAQARPMDIWYKGPGVLGPGPFPTADLKIHAKVTDKDATTMSVGVLSSDEETYTEHITDHSFTADDTFETVSHTLTNTEMKALASVEDWKQLFSFNHTGGVGSTQTLLPSADTTTTGWLYTGGSDFNVLKDSSNLTLMYTPKDNSQYTYEGTIGTSSKPETIANNDVYFTVTARGVDRFDVPCYFRIYYNSGSNYYQFPMNIPTTATNPWDDYTFHLTSSQADSLDWGTAFSYQIIKRPSGATKLRGLRVSEVKMNTPAVGGQGFISDAWLEMPGYQGFEVSFQDFILPNDNDEKIGDQQKIYAGSTTKLWNVSEAGTALNDVSRSGDDYGQDNSLIPQVWDFCSWGGNVIATNFDDEVQLFNHEGGGTLFVDLMSDDGSHPTDEYQVQAKYCDIVKNHLVLANIGAVQDFDDPTPTAYTGAFSYTVWWSAINDPSLFKIGDYANLSDLEHLRQRRGEITGFLGGEYGTIWKRDSIFRMSWVGGNLVFRFDLLADGVGTSHPKSIVSKDSDIYFYGHNDFYVMPGGGKPQPLGIGRIKSLLVESGHDERAINRDTFSAQREHDMRVCGAYDQLSGLIFWSIDNGALSGDTKTSSWKHKTDIIVYNPVKNSWGYIRDSNFHVENYGVGAITATPTIPGDDSTLLGNLYLFVNDFTTSPDELKMVKFSSDNFSAMDVTTNVFTAGALGADTEAMSLSAVRPMFERFGLVGNTSNSSGPLFDPEYSGTVYCSPDPLMISNVSSSTFSSDDTNENGWAQLSNILNGEFWKINLVFPEYSSVQLQSNAGLIKSLLGIGLDITPGGHR